MPGLGLPTTGRITSGATPKLPSYATPRMPSGQVAGVGIPMGAKLIAQGSGMGSGQVPASDPYGQLPATAANYHPYEPSTQPGMPATDGSGFVAPGGGIGSAMRYDAATHYQGNAPSHPVNFATGAGMGYHPTNVQGVFESGGNNFTNLPSVYGAGARGLSGVAAVADGLTPQQAHQQLTKNLSTFSSGRTKAGLPGAVPPVKAPLPTAPTPFAGAAINKAFEPDPFNGAAIQNQYEPAAQQAGNFIGSSIGDAWGAGPGVPTAPDAPTFSPSKWAGTHAVEDAYNSGLGRFTTSGIGDYWGAGKGMPKAPKVPAIYDPADWWISKQLGSFGRGLAGS
jgi:hypothetical protein